MSQARAGRFLASLLALAAAAACSRKEAPVDPRKPRLEVPEKALQGAVRTSLDSPNPTPAQLARKARSIAAVKAMGLPVIDHLPVVEDEAALAPRTTEEVAGRCLAVEFAAVKGESNDSRLVQRLVDEHGVRKLLSPKEAAFLANPSPSKQDLADFAWGYECVHVFLWALGYLPELKPPDEIADVPHEAGLIRERGPGGLARGAKLRPMAEILDQADLYYRIHWAVTELREKGAHSDRANPEIVMERHRALNWLIRYMNQAWDDVRTDT
jgi:hypothetical protein